MKDNPLFNCEAVLHFDPIDLEDPAATPSDVAQAVEDVYAAAAMLGLAVNAMAMRYSTYDGGLWAFVTSLDGRTGFWYPLDRDTYTVEREESGYSHAYMQATAFGAGLTVAALRHYVEYHAETRFHKLIGAIDDDAFAKLQSDYDELRDFVLDLAQDDLIDGESFLGFIDE